MMKDLALIRKLEVHRIQGALLILVRGLPLTACVRELACTNFLSAIFLSLIILMYFMISLCFTIAFLYLIYLMIDWSTRSETIT